MTFINLLYYVILFSLATFAGILTFVVFGIVLAWYQLGQAVWGWAVSIPVRRCIIGVGPLLLQWRWGGAYVALRLAPFFGYVEYLPILRRRKYAQMLFLLGGLWAIFILAAGVLALQALIGPCRCGSVANANAMIFLVPALLVLVCGRAGLDGMRTGGDIWQVLKLARRRSGELTDIGAIYLAALRTCSPSVDASAVDSPAAPLIVLQAYRADRLVERRAFHDMRQQLQPLLTGGALTAAEEMLVLDTLLTEAVVFGDVCPMTQLDEWSRRAVELGPTCDALAESRASVLIELGRYAEGKDILDRVGMGKVDFGGLLRRLFLAKAEYGLGNIDTARQLLAETQRVAEACKAGEALRARISRLAAEIGGKSDPRAASAPPSI